MIYKICLCQIENVFADQRNSIKQTKRQCDGLFCSRFLEKSQNGATLTPQKLLYSMKHLVFVLLCCLGSRPTVAQSMFDNPFFNHPFFQDDFFHFDNQQIAQFPGGEAAFEQYLADNLHYPRAAKRHDIEGVVVVQFTVAKDGSIVRPSIKQSLGYGCDEEALRVVQKMPRWQPAARYGQTIEATYNMPISFQAVISESKAAFKGGNGALNRYLAQHIVYPTDAIYEGMEGTVMVSFWVTKSGKIKRPSIHRSLYPSLDAEALKVVKRMPNWIAATRNKKKVNQHCVMPIVFKLPKTKRILM